MNKLYAIRYNTTAEKLFYTLLHIIYLDSNGTQSSIARLRKEFVSPPSHSSTELCRSITVCTGRYTAVC
jgi:hypothetical protein